MFGRSGISLIELMVVVAIVGILAVTIVPNYKRYLDKSVGAKIVQIVPQLEAQWADLYLRGDTSQVQVISSGQIEYVQSIYFNPSAYSTPLIQVLLTSEVADVLGTWADQLKLLYIPNIANGMASFSCKYEGPNAMVTNTDVEVIFKGCVSCNGAC